jgi:superfamily II DNA or RNA helicase
MLVNIFVGAGKLCITPVLPLADVRILKGLFTFVVHGFEYTKQHQMYGWDGSVCLFKKKQELPLGCLYRAKNALKKIGYKVQITFASDIKPNGEITVDDFQLDPFQITAVKKALKCRYGIVVAPVRAGKTAISAALIRAVGHYPAWVVTNRRDLVLQTRADIAKHLSRPIGLYSEGRYEPNDITVTSYDALRAAFTKRVLKDPIKIQRNKEVRYNWERSKIVILDECHHAAARKFEGVLRACVSTAYQIGLTATPQSGTLPVIEFESKVGCVISKIPYNTLIEKGRLAQPLVIMYSLPYAWYSTYLPTYDDVVTSNLIENQYRNKFICAIAAQFRKEGKTCFIQVSRIEHGIVLNNMISESVFVRGSMEGQTRKDIYKSLHEKLIYCVIGTVGKEGLNIPSLDAVVNAEGSKSPIANKQKMRSLTACEGKRIGIIIDFLDKGKYLMRHSKKRLKMYQSLAGFKIRIRRVPKTYFPMENTRWQAK